MKKRIIVNNKNYLVESVIGFIKTVIARGRTQSCNGILVSYNERKNQYTIEMKHKKDTLFINIINEEKMNCLLIKERPSVVLKEDNFAISQMKQKVGKIVLKLLADNQDIFEAYMQNIRVYSNTLYRSIFVEQTAEQPRITATRPARQASQYFVPLAIDQLQYYATTTTTAVGGYSTPRSYSPGRVNLTFDIAEMPNSTAITATTTVREPTLEELHQSIGLEEQTNAVLPPSLSLDQLTAVVNNIIGRRNNNNDEF